MKKYVLMVVLMAVAVSSAAREAESYLLKIDLQKRDAVYELVELKVSILQEFSKYVIAELEEGYLDTLKKKDFKYKILDKNPKKNLYYLVLVPNKDDLQILEKYGKVLNFDGKTALLKVKVKDVKGLFTHKFMLKKLRKSPIRKKKKINVANEALLMTLLVNPTIADMVAQVSQGDITGYIQELQDFTTRYSTTTGCENASIYIYNQFDSMGLDVEYHDFGSSMADNVIATQYGVVDPARIYIICAHYDSTSGDPLNNAPGADDNASGSAVVLEAASVLSQYQFNYTIKYICFSGEEQGLIGSGNYSSEAAASGDNIDGVVNFDMIGYVDIPVEDLEIIGNSGSEWLVDQMVLAAQAYTTLDTNKIIDPGIIYSDHSPFWDESYSALCSIEDYWPTNPNYHTTLDTFSTLSLDFTTEVTRLAVAILAELAEPHYSGVVILFDTSGSMSWSHTGVSGVPPEEQRLTFAKTAAYPFMELLNDHGGNWVNFGIAVFPPHPWDYSVGCNGQVVTPMTLTTTSSKDTAISTTIPGLVAEGDTPLLAGINTAKNMFGAETNRAIVLLSDGYHNCPDYVDITDPEVTNLVNQLISQNIKVYTIGFGRPTDLDPLLDTLASETTGQFYDVTGPGFVPVDWTSETAAAELQSTYKSILADALELETPVDPTGIIRGDEKVTQQVIINKNDKIVSFYLSWVTPNSKRLVMAVTTSDGNPVNPGITGVRVHTGKTYQIMTFLPAFLQQPGKVGATPWKIEIVPGDMKKEETEHYQYSVIISSDLKMKVALDETSYETGDRITITAKITEKGKPVTRLEEVFVKVRRPGEGIGNWFARNKVTEEELKQIPSKIGEEKISRILQKSLFLTDIRKVPFPIQGPIRRETITLRLYDDGSHGDPAADDGSYTNQYTVTLKEGTYRFYVTAKGTDQNNVFQREALLQEYVSVKPDANYIFLDVLPISTEESKKRFFKLIITPKDALGNFMGPRYSGLIKVKTSEGGKLIDTLTDQLDGTYTQTLLLSGKISLNDVDITVMVKGVECTYNLARQLQEPLGISFHLGSTIPIGNLNQLYNPGLSLGWNLDYHFTSQVSLVGYLGYNRFNPGLPGIDDTYWWNISANLKYEFNTNPLRPYINGGAGIYIPKNGNVKPGVNFGLGWDFSINANWIVELGGDYHRIFTGGTGTSFFTAHTGLIFRF